MKRDPMPAAAPRIERLPQDPVLQATFDAANARDAARAGLSVDEFLARRTRNDREQFADAQFERGHCEACGTHHHMNDDCPVVFRRGAYGED